MKVVILLVIVLCVTANCVNLGLAYPPASFETGACLKAGEGEIAFRCGVAATSTSDEGGFEFGGDVRRGFLDYLTGSLSLDLTGGLDAVASRCNVGLAMRLLDIGYVRSSLSGNLGLAFSSTDPGEIFGKDYGWSRFVAFNTPAALNICIFPTGKGFGIFASIGIDPMFGRVDGSGFTSFSFTRLYYTLGTGVSLEVEHWALRIAGYTRLGSSGIFTEIIDYLSPEYPLYYEPLLAVQLVFKFAKVP